jgi:bacteriocin biosynthesis cyclodehydratase domain-containing protein
MTNIKISENQVEIMELHRSSRPRLKGFVHLIPEQTRIQVRWDEHAVLLTSEPAVRLVKDMAPLLNGSLTVDELISQLSVWDRKDVTDVLEFFNKYELLEDASRVSPFTPEQQKQWGDQLLYFSHFSTDKYSLQENIVGTCVLVLGEGILYREVLSALEEAGMCIVGPGDTVPQPSENAKTPASKEEVKKVIAETGADITVVATSKLFSPLFSWVNTASLSCERPWTSCSVYGGKGVVGPTVIPGQTPCYTCLRLRRSSNLVHYDEFSSFETYMEEHPYTQVSTGVPTGLPSCVAHICVLELIKLVTGIGPVKTAGGQITFNPLTMEMDIHPILKLPRCPDCGLPSKEVRTEKVWMK